MRGKVTLVGAGPGDPELLTVRACKRLSEADVICYDRLVHKDILALFSKEALLIDVGRRDGLGETSQARQERIFGLLVDHALEGKHVVRLKGGDPYVFGRGAEEVQVLMEAGIDCEVVPGISSALAVPALVDIPLTLRGVSSAFGVFTGHLAAEGAGSVQDWSLAARMPTAVFLMGVKHLLQIAHQLVAHGRSGTEPVAVIERGTWPGQRVIEGTLQTIAQQCAADTVKSPAVIVVGEVVRCRQRMSALLKKPLSVGGVGIQPVQNETCVLGHETMEGFS